jgi:hypothetical protein
MAKTYWSANDLQNVLLENSEAIAHYQHHLGQAPSDALPPLEPRQCADLLWCLGWRARHRELHSDEASLLGLLVEQLAREAGGELAARA